MMVMVIENRAQNDGTGPKNHQNTRSRYILAHPCHTVPINDPINDPINQHAGNTDDLLVIILVHGS